VSTLKLEASALTADYYAMFVQDLLSGANLLFGNPLDKFWESAKAGRLHPRVVRVGDGIRVR
jgi:hypothetical protein